MSQGGRGWKKIDIYVLQFHTYLLCTYTGVDTMLLVRGRGHLPQYLFGLTI